MRTFVGPFLLIAFSVIVLSSCTRATSDKSHITIKFPESTSVASSNVSAKTVGVLSSKWQQALPLINTEVNCYALAVIIPEGTHDISCDDSSGYLGSPDLLMGGFPAGSEAVVDIPKGSGRKLYLLGFKTDDVSLCKTIPETGGAFPVGNFSSPVVLQGIVKDILPVEDTVEFTVPTSLTNLITFEDCSPKSFASETAIFAYVSGVPPARTGSSFVDITVSGFNVSEYQYAITSSPSCVGVTYSAFQPLGFHINDTGLADGQKLLCVIGRSSTGAVQTFPTVRTWIVDTTANVASGISVASSLGKNPTPVITVSGVSVGDSVQLFKGPTPCTNAIGTATSSGTTVAVTPSSSLSEGNNTITAIITDSVGNVGACSSTNGISAAYNLDTIPPVTVAAYLDNIYGTSLFYTPLYTWAATSDTNSGVNSYEVRIDSGPWVNVGLNTSYYAMQSMAVTSHSFDVQAVDNAGNYSAILSDTFTVNNTPPWRQQAYGKASNAGAGDTYGWSVAVDGDYMVVGAPSESSAQQGPTNSSTSDSSNTLSGAGAAYVYHRNFSGQWTQTAFLKAANPVAGDNFGNAVAISGNTIIVGAYKESSSSTTIINSSSGDNTATSSVQVGAAYVFVFDGTNWGQQAYIKAPNAPASLSSWFGYSVAIDKNTIVVGAPYLPDTHTGVFTSAPAVTTSGTTAYGGAYIFKRSGTNWAFNAYLKPPQVQPAMRFGDSVAISSGTVVVSAINESSRTSSIINSSTGSGPLDGSNNGAVYVFKDSGSTWQQQAYIKPSNISDNDDFGSSVAIFNDLLVVGAKGEDNSGGSAAYGSIADDNTSLESGAAYVFRRSSNTWTGEAYLKASNHGGGDNFGTAVAIWGSTVVVGATGEGSCTNSVMISSSDTGNSCAFSGAAYAFQRDVSNNWTETAYFKASNNNTSDTIYPYTEFGHSVAINGSTIVVGSDKEAGGTNSFINGTSAGPGTGGANYSGSIYLYFPY